MRYLFWCKLHYMLRQYCYHGTWSMNSEHCFAQMQPAGKRKSPIHGPNQWPRQLPAFDGALRQYLDTMLQLGSTILRGDNLQGHNCKTHFWLPVSVLDVDSIDGA